VDTEIFERESQLAVDKRLHHTKRNLPPNTKQAKKMNWDTDAASQETERCE